MSLQKKTLLILAATLTGLLVVLYVAERYILLRRFDALEKSSVQRTTRRGLLRLEMQLHNLDQHLTEYSCWTPTVRFLSGDAGDYEEEHLPDASFGNLGANVLVLLGAEGGVVFSKGYDLAAGEVTAVPGSLMAHLKSGSPLLRHDGPGSVVKGVLSLPEGLLMVVTQPVTESSGEGPVYGVALLGRFLTDALLNEDMFDGTEQVEIVPAGEEPVREDNRLAWEALRRGGAFAERVFVRADSQEVVAGYILVDDVYGNPAFLFKMLQDRPIHRQKVLTERLLLASLVVIWLVFGVTAHLLFQRQVLLRLYALNDTAREVARSGDASQRMQAAGSDEIAELAASMNAMLERLQVSQGDLIRSKETATALMNATTDAAVLVGLETEVLEANAMAARLSGRQQSSDLIGARFRDVFPERVAARWMEEHRAVIEQNVRRRFEDERDSVIFDISMYPVHDQDGQIKQVAIFVRNITRRRRAQEALRRSEEYYRRILAATSEGFAWMSAQGEILDVNSAFCELIGRDRAEIIGIPMRDFLAETVAHFWPRGRQSNLARRTEAENRAFETVLLHKDGHRIPVVVSGSSLQNDAGEEIARIAFLTDISELKKMQDLREDVERITRHDLKNPLTSILTMPKFLKKQGNLTVQQVECLDTIESAAYRMLQIINSSLDLYKMEKKSYKLKKSPVDLVPMVWRIFSDFRYRARSGRLELQARLESQEVEDADQFIVKGDDGLLYSMLANLIKNAIEAAPHESKVCVDFHEGDESEIRIHNAGVIPEAVRENFFDKYSTHGKNQGTGLGTYSARLIVETHGGAIRFDTSEAKGTTLFIRLPKN